MTERGTAPAGPAPAVRVRRGDQGPRAPVAAATSAEVRIDEPVTRNDRDVVLIWNYQSPTRFYYAHLSQDNTIYPHNGIFVVDDADRRRIDDQWNGTDLGAPPAIDDTDWHDVRLDYARAHRRDRGVRRRGAHEPLMTATDTTFAGGRVGVRLLRQLRPGPRRVRRRCPELTARPRTTLGPATAKRSGDRRGCRQQPAASFNKEFPTVAAVGREEVMRKSRWWVAAATGALAAALLAPVSSAQSSSRPRAGRSRGRTHLRPDPRGPGAVVAGAGAGGVPPVPEDRAHPGADRPPADAARPDQLHRRRARRHPPPVRARPQRPALPARPTASGTSTSTSRREFPDFFSGRGMGSGFGFVTFDPEFEKNGKFYTVHTEKFADLSTKPTTYPSQPNTFLHGVVTEWTADDPRREHVHTAPAARSCGSASRRRSTASSRSTSTPRRPSGTATTACCTSPPATAASALNTDIPQTAGEPLRQDPADRPRRHRRPERRSTASRGRTPSSATTGAVGEIYALGMRDPHRFCWDAGGQHRMYLGHIGQHAIEGVYEVRRR